MQTADMRAHRTTVKPLSVRALLVVATNCCFAALVVAAPLTAGNDTASDTPEAGRPRNATQSLDEQRIADSHAQSKTIKMLLEMQHAPAPLEGAGHSKREQAAQARVAKAAGLPEVPVQTSTEPVVDWRSGLPGRTVAGHQVPENAPPSGGRAEGALVRTNSRPVAEETSNMLRDLLPGNWIDYLRENRQWVLGAGLGLLALGWLAATVFTRRR
jgi:hypothetical protein